MDTYTLSQCDGCLQAFDVVDSDYYLSMFDKEELQADCPYCGTMVYVSAYVEE